MIVAILFLAAFLEVALGAAVLGNAKSSIHEVLGLNILGFGILTFGVAELQRELRKASREAAKERQFALEERQARAAFDLKRRSGMISSIDRQQKQTESADRHPAIGWSKSRMPRNGKPGLP